MSVPGGLFASYSDPPPARTFDEDRPTLLVTWWCTICCVALIVMRLMGRYVRVSKLYRDDKFMALTIIPLLVRQAFVHVVLLYGTNNVTGTEGMDREELRRRQVGSGMVLGARVTYAAFLWSQKFCITEFYARLTEHFWERNYEVGLRVIRWSLLFTFLGATISVFGECRPGHKLWQVYPDPGSSCRSGFAPLLTISTFSIITDALLVLSPIPAIVRSSFTTVKKIRLIVTVFSLSLACIAITSYRVPGVIQRHGSQQYRSLFATFEILTATIVSNATVINSFARDKGTKKRKFSGESGIADAKDGHARMAYWGSDDDLARHVGVGRVGSTGNGEEIDPITVVDSVSPTRPPARAKEGWELNDLGHDAPTKLLPSPSQKMETPILYDISGLLKGGGSECDDCDEAVSMSTSSSSVGLRDIVAEQRKVQ